MIYETTMRARLWLAEIEAGLQNFYKQNFSQESLNILGILTEGIILKEWESNYELFFAEKLFNTSKARFGTSAETICLEVIPLMSELVATYLPQILLQKNYQLSLLEESKAYEELPQFLGVFYTAFLNLDILSGRFVFQRNAETGYISVSGYNS